MDNLSAVDFHPQRSFSRPNPRSPVPRSSFSSDVPSLERNVHTYSPDCKISQDEISVNNTSLFCVAHFCAIKVTLIDNVLGCHLPLLQVNDRSFHSTLFYHSVLFYFILFCILYFYSIDFLLLPLYLYLLLLLLLPFLFLISFSVIFLC